jgi:multicomponent Na+:H+ antiporter subunit G
MIDIASMILIGIGCFLSLVGGLGLFRLPDFYARLHAVGVTDTLCSFLILSGLALQSGLQLITIKLLFIFMFLLFTSPTASFALANSAWRWGLRNDDPEASHSKEEEPSS